VAEALRQISVPGRVRDFWPVMTAGHVELTPAEMAVLRLIATGMTNDQIARTLSKRPSTVKIQAGSIFRKLGVHSRVSAAMWYWRNEAG